MFWFFKKRENKEVHAKIVDIEKSLQSSFRNVKTDMETLSSHIEESRLHHHNHKNKLDLHDQKIKAIESKIDTILIMLKKEHNIRPQQKPEEALSEENFDKDQIIENLTSNDKRLLTIIYHLQKQLNGNPISFKSLASMAYAGQDYVKIRSTISQYLNTLYKFGIIDKRRHGREALIYLTEYGQSLIEGKIKQENKIKSKKKQQI